MKLSNQHQTILKVLNDHCWHCALDFPYMFDLRKRLSELIKDGFIIESKPCDGRCGSKHNARVFMRRLAPFNEPQPKDWWNSAEYKKLEPAPIGNTLF